MQKLKARLRYNMVHAVPMSHGSIVQKSATLNVTGFYLQIKMNFSKRLTIRIRFNNFVNVIIWSFIRIELYINIFISNILLVNTLIWLVLFNER